MVYNNKNLFKIALLNIRSLLPKFTEFKDLIQKYKYELILVTETWLNNNIIDDVISLEDYKLFRKDRNGRGGGVAVYIKNIYNCLDIHLEFDHTEQLWICLNIQGNSFAVGLGYRPPNFSFVDFVEELEEGMTFIAPRYNQIIYAGDLNIDFLNPNSAAYKKIYEVIENFDLTQIVTSPTRIGKTSLTLLDVVFCSNADIVNSHEVIDVPELSDHCLVSVSLNLKLLKSLQPRIYTYRNFKYFNTENFKLDLEQCDFMSIVYCHNIDEKISILKNIVTDLFDKHAPVKTARLVKKSAPWLTDNIRLLMNQRDKALKRFRNTGLPNHYDYYKNLRNFTNLAIKNEKKAFLTHKINGKFSSSIVWKSLRELNVYSKQRSQQIPTHLSDPDTLNNFFVSSSNYGNTPDSDKLGFYSNNISNDINQFSFSLTDEREVFNCLQAIKTQATGIDGINIQMLLYCCPIILRFLTHIINECILHNYFPKEWKYAKVLPFPKIKEPNELKDLRNICILPTLSKVMEKILNNQIRTHLIKYNILNETQSGFRPGYSCATAVLGVVDDILSAADDNKLTALILLDYSKAFDRINHGLLLALLHYYGFGREALELMKSYLWERRQEVVVNGKRSNVLTVSSGVPQGSILGPLLFIIYTSCFQTNLQHCKTHFYADDTQVYFSFNKTSAQEAKDIINSDLESLLEISNKFCLSINPLKSKIILFGNKNSRENIKNILKINIGNNELEFVSVARNLGLYLDADIKFTQHVNMLMKRAYSNMKLIYGCNSWLEKETKIMLCDSLILSHFNYGDVIYNSCLSKHDNLRIQKVQNACVRIIYGIKRHESVSLKLKELGWLNMAQRRLLHSAVVYHKILTTKSPPYLYNKIHFRYLTHKLNTRNKNIITPPFHRTASYERAFKYNLAKIYNSVPENIKKLSIYSFRKHIRDLIFKYNFNPLK